MTGPDLRALLAAFEAAEDAVTVQARACFVRAINDLRLRRIRFGALGLACDEDPDPLDSQILRWPGAAAFPGVARIELPARAGLAQELPIGDVKVGTLALALPVFAADWPCQVEDIVWCDPRHPAHWARATGLAARLGPDPAHRLEPDRPVRLRRDPLTWFRGLAAGDKAAVCLLDPLGTEGETLLLGPPLTCDDAAHAAAIEALQKRARARALRALPRPGRLLIARTAAEQAA